MGGLYCYLGLLAILVVAVLAQVDPTRNCTGTFAAPVTRVDTTVRVAALREKMRAAGVHAFLIPTRDEHGNEYVGDADLRRPFITGFSGSAGTAVVTLTKQAVWTDGRYFLQAAKELDCNWWLMRQGEPGVKSIKEWLKDNLVRGNKIGADPSLLSASSWLDYVKSFKPSGISMVRTEDLVGKVWDASTESRRPAPSNKAIFPLAMKFAGRSWEDKIGDVRKKLADESVDAVVVSALDEVAWLFNLRGSDIAYNPVFFGYAIVEKDENVKPILYLRDSANRLSKSDLRSHLACQSSGICTKMEVKTYTEVESGVAAFNDLIKNKTVWIPSSTNYKLYSTITNTLQIVNKPSPLLLMKAVKNDKERQGMRNSHLRDSAAIIKFISRLEAEINEGVHWDELKVVDEIRKQREKEVNFKEESFGTIAGSGKNGAVIHYTPNTKDNLAVNKNNMLLLDSGGQYLDGTTDITRTFHFGTPTDFQKKTYTLVLQGVINLARAIFPANTTLGSSLDTFARSEMWREGLIYRHGTGHGIGMFLNVHEGPARISQRYASSSVSTERPIYDGMFFSDEPGYYDAARGFGIRLETIVMAAYTPTEYGGDQKYLTFEPIALVPFESNLIDLDMLDNHQRQWLNDYHSVVQNKVSKFIKNNTPNETRALNWLAERTKAVPMNEFEPFSTTSTTSTTSSSASGINLSAMVVASVALLRFF